MSFSVSANQNEAKAKFLTANALYENKQYHESLVLLNQVKNMLGGNARVSALEIKLHLGMNDIPKAKKSLDEFYKYKASSDLILDLSKNIALINMKYKHFNEIKTIDGIKNFIKHHPSLRSLARKREYYYVDSVIDESGKIINKSYDDYGDVTSPCNENISCTSKAYDENNLLLEVRSESKNNGDTTYKNKETYIYDGLMLIQKNSSGFFKLNDGKISDYNREDTYHYLNGVLTGYITKDKHGKHGKHGKHRATYKYYSDGSYEVFTNNANKDTSLGKYSRYGYYLKHILTYSDINYSTGREWINVKYNVFGRVVSYILRYYDGDKNEDKKIVDKAKYNYKKMKLKL